MCREEIEDGSCVRAAAMEEEEIISQINQILPEAIRDLIIQNLVDLSAPEGQESHFKAEQRVATQTSTHLMAVWEFTQTTFCDEYEMSDDSFPADNSQLINNVMVIFQAGQNQDITTSNICTFLPIMSLLGDIGKAGGLNQNTHELIKKIYTQINAGSIESRVQSEDINLPEDETLRSQLAAYQNALKGKNPKEKPKLLEQPYRLAFYLSQQVAELTPVNVDYFKSLGLDPDTTPLGKFYTELHIRIAEEIIDKLDQPYREIGILAISHHFSQGTFPEILASIITTGNAEVILRTIALLECLDKYDAFTHRSHQSCNPLDKTLAETQANLKKNISDIVKRIPELARFTQFAAGGNKSQIELIYQEAAHLAAKMLKSSQPGSLE